VEEKKKNASLEECHQGAWRSEGKKKDMAQYSVSSQEYLNIFSDSTQTYVKVSSKVF